MTNEEYERRSVRRWKWTIAVVIANITFTLLTICANTGIIYINVSRGRHCNQHRVNETYTAMPDESKDKMETNSETMAITNVQNSL